MPSLIEGSGALPAQSDKVYGVGGQLLALRLRFRANCGALQQVLRILTEEDFVARYHERPTRADEAFPELLQSHGFAREFGSYFSSSIALGTCIDGIRTAWKESDLLMREVGSDFGDPLFADWEHARLALTGYLHAIGRGDFLVARLLDCHNGLRDQADETREDLNAYLEQLRHWAGM
ncbi:hypothetical protein [Algihabitans albus]|uniref:hypothetical protein n=1 Tax=Algihabitans albus TaxID=2164067 RepID=UPI0013C2A8CC|nr:hypothetical protein [Algihabitans albus]